MSQLVWSPVYKILEERIQNNDNIILILVPFAKLAALQKLQDDVGEAGVHHWEVELDGSVMTRAGVHRPVAGAAQEPPVHTPQPEVDDAVVDGQRVRIHERLLHRDHRHPIDLLGTEDAEAHAFYHFARRHGLGSRRRAAKEEEGRGAILMRERWRR